MLAALAVVLPLVVAGVFVAGAAAKLRHPDDLAGWAEIGVPRVLRRRRLVRAHPWAELLLALAVALLGGIPGVIAALIAVAVLAVYLWLVVRVRRRDDGASCACFGARRPVTRLTVARNVWLLIVAGGAVAVIGTNPLWGGALAAAAGYGLGAALAAAVTAATVAFVLWPDSGSVAPAAAGTAPADADDAEYIRTRTPAVPVKLADGTTVNLRDLAARRPILLLAVSEMCGACTAVIESVPAWRQLLPEVDVRLLIGRPPRESRLTEHDEPQSLHDPEEYVRGSIEDWPTPTAVLLGADGLLAGGPVSGDRGVERFVHDVYESLHGVRPPADGTADAEAVTGP